MRRVTEPLEDLREHTVALGKVTSPAAWNWIRTMNSATGGGVQSHD